MPTLLHLVHGYPPRETAGTETATARLVAGLADRGWRCHVMAATRAPGTTLYSLQEEPGVTRMVQNLAPMAMERADRDLAVERKVAQVFARVRPDLVHVHHLAWLSTGLRFPVPTVGTLHDHWAWCAAGGTLLKQDGQACPGPNPADCPACAAARYPGPSLPEQWAVGLAGRLSPWIRPEKLHSLYRRLPLQTRSWAHATGSTPAPAPTAAQWQSRQEAHREAWNRMQVRLAPSAFLADRAHQHGMGPVQVVPHGAGPFPGVRRSGRGPLVFLGTLLPHKGAHLVVEAVRRLPPGAPGLDIWGDPGADPSYAASLGWPLKGHLPARHVPAVLAQARALVLGSLWPENAPLVILEARAVGCPVVAPDIGGIRELVEPGRDGHLVPPGDPAALARTLALLLDSPPLPVAPPLTLKEHVERVEAVYRSVLESAHP